MRFEEEGLEREVGQHEFVVVLAERRLALKDLTVGCDHLAEEWAAEGVVLRNR